MFFNGGILEHEPGTGTLSDRHRESVLRQQLYLAHFGKIDWGDARWLCSADGILGGQSTPGEPSLADIVAMADVLADHVVEGPEMIRYEREIMHSSEDGPGTRDRICQIARCFPLDSGCLLDVEPVEAGRCFAGRWYRRYQARNAEADPQNWWGVVAGHEDLGGKHRPRISWRR